MRSALPLLLLALSGCAAQSPPAHRLADSEWRFVSIDGVKPTSAKAKLTFEDKQMSATVGCNGMGGPWRVQDGRLIAGPLAQTQMMCEPPLWHQEQATSALLVAAPEIALDADRLVLRSSGHFAELERVATPATS